MHVRNVLIRKQHGNCYSKLPIFTLLKEKRLINLTLSMMAETCVYPKLWGLVETYGPQPLNLEKH
jgi:hypothetical protein